MYGYPSSIVVDECDDTTVNVNSVQEGTFPSGSTLDIEVTDGTDPVTPDAVIVTGNTIEIQVPAAVSRTTATLIKTGQTTSYRTGDDGDLEAGRVTSFTALDTAPLHNNGAATLNATTNRFTDILGGQTYADDIVLDWSTWDGSTLLGYRRTFNGSYLTWNDAIDGALAVSIGAFTTGWKLPNFNELNSICNWGLTSRLNYSPFNVLGPGGTGTWDLWTSTTIAVSTSNAITVQHASYVSRAKTNNTQNQYIPCRIFSLSILNVLS